MFAAGINPDQISEELSRQRPIKLISPVLIPRGGIFSMRGVIRHLRTILPKDFSDLQVPFAVGVIDYESKEFSLIDNGDLPEAVAASCAIPGLFKPVLAGGSSVDPYLNRRLYADGGVYILSYCIQLPPCILLLNFKTSMSICSNVLGIHKFHSEIGTHFCAGHGPYRDRGLVSLDTWCLLTRRGGWK